LDESLLRKIASILGISGHPLSQAEDRLLIPPHQQLVRRRLSVEDPPDHLQI
jgi:hypothetical protein